MDGVMPDGGMFMSEALDEVKVGLLHGCGWVWCGIAVCCQVFFQQ